MIFTKLTSTLLSVDTPDPYVKLRIKTAPNGFRRTKAKKNDVNPTWDEVFQFILDPTVKHTLGKLLSFLI